MTDTAHSAPWWRGSDIAARTAHIGTMSILFGGHVFGADTQRLMPWLYATIVTGALLAVIEAYPSWRWCLELRGAMAVAKVLLMCLVPWAWSYRVAILIAVIVIGSVGSHMPRRLRQFQIVWPPE